MPLIVKVRLMVTLIENNTVLVMFSAVHFSRQDVPAKGRCKSADREKADREKAVYFTFYFIF